MPRTPNPARSAAAQLPPLDPRRYAPSAARPVRAKVRWLDPDTEIQPHSHPWAQVAISISGVARITAGDSTYLVPAWRAVWIPPAIEHVVAVVEAAELRTLYVHQPAGTVGPGVPAADRGPWQQCRVLEVSRLLRELVLQMDIQMDAAMDGQSGRSGHSVEIGDAHPGAIGGTAGGAIRDMSSGAIGGAASGLFGGARPPAADLLARERRLGELALDELRRAAPVRLGIDLPRDKRLRALCEAVIAEPTRHATLDGWATDAGASPRTIARLFREQLGSSFGPWRQQVLLARALTLAARGRPMALIAADLGYASASAFTAMVRRSVGEPPGRFFGRFFGRSVERGAERGADRAATRHGRRDGAGGPGRAARRRHGCRQTARRLRD